MQIPQSRLVARLQIDNPWWTHSSYDMSQAVPEERRLYFPLFRKLLSGRATGRACLLMGPRGAGKTVLARQIILDLLQEGTDAKRIVYFPLKNPVYFSSSPKECIAFATEGKCYAPYTKHYLIFDDLQYIQHWEKELHDVAEANPLSQIIGISSVAPLDGPSGKSRTFAKFLLPAINFAEYMHLTQNTDLFDPPERELPGVSCPSTRNLFAVNRHFINYLRTGGCPEAVFSWEMRRSPENFARSGILDKILLSDVPNLYGIGEIKELNRFFCSLALNNGQETSQDRLRKDARLAKNTMRRYLEYLEDCFLINRVRRVDENNKEFIRERHFRLFLANPGLYTALFAVAGDGEEEQDEAHMAALVRSAIFSQFGQGRGKEQLRYARWAGGEIDCLFFTGARKRVGSKLGNPAWIASFAWVDDPESRPDSLQALSDYRALHNYKGPMLFISRSKSGPLTTTGGLELELVPASLFCYGISAQLFESEPEGSGN